MNNVGYFKRVEGEKVLQIWLQTIKVAGSELSVNLVPYTCERAYFGEGFKNYELIPVSLDKFRELGNIYNCFVKEETPIPC